MLGVKRLSSLNQSKPDILKLKRLSIVTTHFQVKTSTNLLQLKIKQKLIINNNFINKRSCLSPNSGKHTTTMRCATLYLLHQLSNSRCAYMSKRLLIIVVDMLF